MKFKIGPCTRQNILIHICCRTWARFLQHTSSQPLFLLWWLRGFTFSTTVLLHRWHNKRSSILRTLLLIIMISYCWDLWYVSLLDCVAGYFIFTIYENLISLFEKHGLRLCFVDWLGYLLQMVSCHSLPCTLRALLFSKGRWVYRKS